MVVGGSKSEWGNINAGVPQGSVLGPLLFLVYINDMSEGLQSNLCLFADDNLMYVISDNAQHCARVLNDDLVKLEQWAKKWIVKFNPDKTHSMAVSTRNLLPDDKLNMHNRQLENVSQTQHLGVNIQQNLKWDNQIDDMCTKANTRLDILNSLSKTLSRRSLDILYKTYVRSVLEYSDVLFCNTTQLNFDKLDEVEKRAGRIVSGAIRGTSSDTLYSELSWESLRSRRENRMLLLYSDIVHGRAPDYLSEHIPPSVEERIQGGYNLRNRHDLTTPGARTETFRNSFIPTMTNVWNNTDPAVRSIESRNALRRNLNINRRKCNPFFLLGQRKLNIILARIRMRCSELNQHLFDLHIIPNPNCQCGDIESTFHFFTQCPNYDINRTRLVNQFNVLEVDFDLDVLLHGCGNDESNVIIIRAVDEFVTGTRRFTLLN